jgi:hypothetical protein
MGSELSGTIEFIICIKTINDKNVVIATDVLSPEFAGITNTRLFIRPRNTIGNIM